MDWFIVLVVVLYGSWIMWKLIDIESILQDILKEKDDATATDTQNQ